MCERKEANLQGGLRQQVSRFYLNRRRSSNNLPLILRLYNLYKHKYRNGPNDTFLKSYSNRDFGDDARAPNAPLLCTPLDIVENASNSHGKSKNLRPRLRCFAFTGRGATISTLSYISIILQLPTVVRRILKVLRSWVTYFSRTPSISSTQSW